MRAGRKDSTSALNVTETMEYITCPIHKTTHEIYKGYRKCPFVREKIDLIAIEENKEPIHIISTGEWNKSISREKLFGDDANVPKYV